MNPTRFTKFQSHYPTPRVIRVGDLVNLKITEETRSMLLEDKGITGARNMDELLRFYRAAAEKDLAFLKKNMEAHK